MYDYALNILEAEAKKLENEMEDSLKAGDWLKNFTPTKKVAENQMGLFEEAVLIYQRKIYDINDAIETLKSIAGVDTVNNKDKSDDKG